MIVSINQPAYLPWPGYFSRIQASDLHIVLADALRAGHELSSYPGEANLRMKQDSLGAAYGWKY